jgi:hypothetical protein
MFPLFLSSSSTLLYPNLTFLVYILSTLSGAVIKRCDLHEGFSFRLFLFLDPNGFRVVIRFISGCRIMQAIFMFVQVSSQYFEFLFIFSQADCSCFPQLVLFFQFLFSFQLRVCLPCSLSVSGTFIPGSGFLCFLCSCCFLFFFCPNFLHCLFIFQPHKSRRGSPPALPLFDSMYNKNNILLII